MVVAGEKLLIRFETANTWFDKLYFGSKDDAFKSPYVQGTARSGGGWVFEFELPASYRGTPMPIALGKPDGGWYTTKDLVISIPADGDCDTGTEISDAEMKMVAAGGFNESSFKISSSTAALIGNTIYCTITGEMTGVHAGKPAVKLYLGSRDDKDKSSAVSGSVNGLQDDLLVRRLRGQAGDIHPRCHRLCRRQLGREPGFLPEHPELWPRV